jgi:hypothetical protein
MMTFTGTIRLVCEGRKFDGRICESVARVEVEEPVHDDRLEETADDLARELGWGDHKTCPECHDRDELDAHECDQGDAERLERGVL